MFLCYVVFFELEALGKCAAVKPQAPETVEIILQNNVILSYRLYFIEFSFPSVTN